MKYVYPIHHIIGVEKNGGRGEEKIMNRKV